MTAFLEIDHARIAYDVTGDGTSPERFNSVLREFLDAH